MDRLDIARPGWAGRIQLRYGADMGRTRLESARHEGPLRIQKALYPEGPEVCQHILLHPPGGLVAGDSLDIDVELGTHARVQLTTPGAGKWYRGDGRMARQSLRCRVHAGAVLEWLPQESILFEGTSAELEVRVELDDDAIFFGWDMLCLGRRGAGEAFRHGVVRISTEIERGGRCLWWERGHIEGGGAQLDAPAVLAGQPVSASFLCAADAVDRLDNAWLADCRRLRPAAGEGAMTRLPGLIVARYLGTDARAAHAYFVSLWQRLRPAVAGREALPPRIWAT